MKLDPISCGARRVVSLVEEPYPLDRDWDSAAISPARRWMELRLKGAPRLLDLGPPRRVAGNLRRVGDLGYESRVGHQLLNHHMDVTVGFSTVKQELRVDRVDRLLNRGNPPAPRLHTLRSLEAR